MRGFACVFGNTELPSCRRNHFLYAYALVMRVQVSLSVFAEAKHRFGRYHC